MATTPSVPDSTSNPSNASNASAKVPDIASPTKAPRPKGGGRFTPKAGRDPGVVRVGGPEAAKTAATTGRYTPPTPHNVEAAPETKPWIPWVMFAMMALGLLLIVFNYVDFLLPNSPSNWYLLAGIGAISVGFIAATQLY